MSDSRSLKTIGGFVALVGVVVLLIGTAMPATSTHTSETCVDDPTGFGQECVGGSVTTPNPLKGPMIGVGFLALIGGIGIFLMSGEESSNQQVGHQSETAVKGSFAEKLQERKGDVDTDTPPDHSSESKN